MDSSKHGNQRVRARRACLPCAKRKRKCDGQFPCDICTGYGYECAYQPGTSQVYSHTQQAPSPFQNSRHGNVELERPSGDDSGSWTPVIDTSNPLHTTERVQESSNGLLAVASSRYLGRNSAEAFPRFLALQMQAQILPKLQPFVWNLSVRPDPAPKVKGAICSFINLGAVRQQVQSFFVMDFPASACLNLNNLLDRCERHWAGHNQGIAFEAIICGVIGLAAALGHTSDAIQESCIIEHAEHILNDSAVLGRATIEVLVALVLRYLYLRATANPQVTWLVNCTTMHMAESLGLHKEYRSNAERDQYALNGWNEEARSRLFWLISAGNRISSHELGRTPIMLQGTTRKFLFAASDTSSIAIFCRVIHILPLERSPENSDDEQTRFSDALGRIAAMRIDQPFLKLITADVCFTMYRRIRVSTNLHITKQQSQQMVFVGRDAVQAVRRLIQERKPWWNILSTLFQFCCILISIDSIDYLGDIKSVMTTINSVRGYHPGNNSAEAVNTLNTLIDALRQRKQAELDCLNFDNYQMNTGINPYGPFTNEAPVLDDFPLSFEDLDWMSADLMLGQ